jgi:hypothetical protein
MDKPKEDSRMVKRYDLTMCYVAAGAGVPDVEESEYGDYVEHGDYAALAERCERLEGAASVAIEAMEDIWKLKGREDDYIYDEMGSQLSHGYFMLRAALSPSSGGGE